ncbi:E3 ubiquitin-protein ligase RNF31 isoform 2-T2 [Pholidichthys leucotaenia]
MPRVGAEKELYALMECGYLHPSETLSDLLEVRSRFPDLRLYVDYYCFPNNDKKKLVFLAGTLPVHYEGIDYNIPVCIWLHETHPASRPRCYVCPSVTMVINSSCPCIDATGNVSLSVLTNWKWGVSSLSLLLSEMRRAFEKDTPLYTRQAPPSPQQAPPIGCRQVTPERFHTSTQLKPTLSASQWEQSGEVRKSYTEQLLGIDFNAPPSVSDSNPFLSSTSSTGPPPVDPLSRMMGALRLDTESRQDQQDVSPVRAGPTVGSEPARGLQRNLDPGRPQGEPAAGSVHLKVRIPPGSQQVSDVSSRTQVVSAGVHLQIAAQLPSDQAAVFTSLMTVEGRCFSPTDVLEAVQLNRDFPSALRFLSHRCPICQDQVSFSKIITMTHCSCFLCQSCFATFFSTAIRERQVHQLVCPQCGHPKVPAQGGLEESMDYFNLLDTQIRHFLSPELHELFQRKLRDRTLQHMPDFCWCAHCSFGMLHESGQLRMDCPSCKKSTCSRCRSPWSPQHQGLSCEQFRAWQQQNQLDQHSSPLLSNSIECPNCQLVFSLSRGGCLHFTCSQCSYQFCGGCSRPFTLGSACEVSTECGFKGLHAHHPRDCLYFLRDWSVTRLHLLLHCYRVSSSWLEPANRNSPDQIQPVCPILELREDSSRDEACGRPVLPEHRGYCSQHYKERLVELINHYRADPAVLFSSAEMKAELQRWNIVIPTRKTDEPEPLYADRLRMTLTNSVPLRKQLRSSIKPANKLCPLTTSVPTEALPPHLLLRD